MQKLPLKLEKRLEKRKHDNSFRSLPSEIKGVDFFSNDYLGFSSSEVVRNRTSEIMEAQAYQNGATGSRLLSGNHPLFSKAEKMIAEFHNAESALIFNSGYDANLGFFSAVPQKGDIIFYDELSHASIRDGIRMSLAKSYKFSHNSLENLESKLRKSDTSSNDFQVYIVTESVFSMDGDIPDLEGITRLSRQYNALLIIDEAHATGVFGDNGVGLVQQLGIEENVFARIQTFGKAIGSHGAAILGGEQLRNYLINFARSFIYTTALPPHTLATLIAVYENLQLDVENITKLRGNINFFKAELDRNALTKRFINSDSAIQSCIVPGNDRVKWIALQLQENDFVVKPILSPTVPLGQERLRFCLHAYNSKQEISEVLERLANFVQKSN
ncbi:8-amino-7-oxononanoate synthase [Gramella sp. Hel_I_59]|uniref:aminotransferase class I/II-fold pyridoxal phosphate-dependent enzyme n=1 Tax=Gramella sp. Hel_I_59 TaxID=1249978 RepID=UPI00115119D9|nr:pyridoxal phosphate-dependent aminotransferase family protein [Gramella sp. Hel_I_59]TQI72170.1 8-amino-7-oxononanoate synthase [Gramella sp. Hel_I_59]